MEMKINLSKAMNRINISFLKDLPKSLISTNESTEIIDICKLSIHLAGLID